MRRNSQDEDIRSLERAAATGEPGAQKKLDMAHLRLGQKIVFQVTNNGRPWDAPYHGLTFNVVVEQMTGPGIGYSGLHVQFHDPRYTNLPAWKEWGQPISGYYVETMLNPIYSRPGAGLDLYGSEPDWKLDGPAHDQVKERITGLAGYRGPKDKRHNSDEHLRELERAAIAGGKVDLERYITSLERIGTTPSSLGEKIADVILKRGKKPALWVEILRDMGADRGMGLRSVADAKRVASLMNKKNWSTVDGIEMPEEFYEPDHERNCERVMAEINALLDTHGVEAINSERVSGPGGFWDDTLVIYCNAGDTYATTVIYDTREDRFFLGSWGSFLETVEEEEGEPEQEEPNEGDGSICHCGEGITWLGLRWRHNDEAVDDLCDSPSPDSGQAYGEQE